MYEKTKQRVYESNIALAEKNLVILTWGNVSELTPDGKAFVIKPSGVSYDELSPEKMVIVNLDGHVIESDYRPSSDTETHRILYQSFDKIGGIVHTHSLYATSFAQARVEIPCLGTTHADHFIGNVPLTRALSKQEIEEGYEVNTGRVIVERMTQIDPEAIPAVLVAGHAPFVWGENSKKAVTNAVALEAIAQMALQTKQLTGQLGPVLESYVLQKHYTRKHGKNAYYGQ
ncbi:L-ribulose-5-phosphate 4-epimerase UlaF [Poriferisphaera corsica]|uniref:L-ribulose-5-phosphate 4-epimerase n=1 Tax=Poriferisphaera corsica TaxID=2528020 RepID=A0A517YSP9_9BACT|nr:L-ribulose-5-phosphate 4-epimerase AraD [Poriferisphaera corsica]QDU33238.1 L-ribulose-5-phosphate 4-epimerase UlaF [Poriferisphaera corsica]